MSAKLNIARSPKKAPLRVGRIAHAGLVIETARTRCLMDPLFGPKVADTFEFDPPMRILHSSLGGTRFDAVVISHYHIDHFCLDSLNRLPRDILVIYPAERVPLIENVLRIMGFRRFEPALAWRPIQVGDLRLVPTPSRAPFPELGMLFSCGQSRVWNAVDTVLDARIIAKVRRLAGPIDAMFCYYQVANEGSLIRNALGSDFLYDTHRAQLQNVRAADPKCAIPSASGLVDRLQGWRNQREFMMSEARFLADLHALAPRIRGVRLLPGQVLEIGQGARRSPTGLRFVKAGKQEPGARQWAPVIGIPPLKDPDPKGYGTARIRKQAQAYLKGAFLGLIHANPAKQSLCPELWRVWRREKLRWELELVYPDGSRDLFSADFSRRKIRWESPKPGFFPHLRTSIAASVLPGVLNGDLSHFAAARLVRIAVREYSVTKTGLQRWERRWGGSDPGTGFDLDPLLNLLFYKSAERWLLKRATTLKPDQR